MAQPGQCHPPALQAARSPMPTPRPLGPHFLVFSGQWSLLHLCFGPVCPVLQSWCSLACLLSRVPGGKCSQVVAVALPLWVCVSGL